MRSTLLKSLALTLGLLCMPGPIPAHAEPGREEDTGAVITGDAQMESERNWVDGRHRQASKSADEMAVWVDSFFGSDVSVEESATSIVRVRPQLEWDEQDDTDWKLRATGRLYLPQADNRLSLVFLGEEGDFEEDFLDPASVPKEGSEIGLEYRIDEQYRSSTYLIASIKAGPKGKLGGRYRYQVPFAKRNRLRFTEELYWVGGDGFGSTTRLDIDRRLTRSTLLRWVNKVVYSEESNGAEWNTSVGWIKKLDNQSALRLFTFVRGETDPEVLKSRGLGVGYRQQCFREWMFCEIEPRYGWRKRRPEVEREGVAQIKLRVEIVFGSGPPHASR